MGKSTLTEINLGLGYYAQYDLKTLWEDIQCCLTAKGYNGFGRADLRILNVENILRGGEVMRNLLYKRTQVMFHYVHE